MESEYITIPEEVEPPKPYPERVERVEAQPEPEDKDGLSDLFTVPQPTDNDMDTEGLFQADKEELEEDDDLSDLTEVSNEDIMGDGFGGEPAAQEDEQTKRYRPSQIKRLKVLRREPPPTSMGGVRF